MTELLLAKKVPPAAERVFFKNEIWQYSPAHETMNFGRRPPYL